MEKHEIVKYLYDFAAQAESHEATAWAVRDMRALANRIQADLDAESEAMAKELGFTPEQMEAVKKF